jgi:hypothetical protein
MRTRLLLAVLSLSALTAAAQVPRSEDLYTPRAFASHIIVPAAGDVPGASGTHFRTDLHIINLSNVDQTVALYWLPQGRSGLAIAPKSVRLNARSGFFSADFVASVLGQTGLGSVEIIAVDANGEEDANAQLHVVARIWTPEPNVANGTMSQSFPALAISNASRATTKWIFGVRREAQYRLNVGIVNTARERQRFRVTLIPNTAGAQSEVVDFDVAARSMDQVRVDGASTGSFQVTVVNLSDAENESDWQAWSSSIDNITGDAWSQIAFPTP